MIRTLLLAALTLLSSCAVSPELDVARAPSEQILLIDLTDEFDTIWTRDAALPDAERAAAFKAEFATLLPGFYSHERVGAEVAAYDERLLTGLRRYPEERAGVAEVSRRFAELLAPAQRSFEAAFGPFAEPQTVYLIHSLGEMDGGMRTLSHGSFLTFGADIIARYHLAHDIQPFFHHELFHVYHSKYFDECEGVWCGLWGEGLATYVAASLNPGATDPELLLTIPEPIRPAVDGNRREAVCAVVQRLDSVDENDARALFSFGRLTPALPPRFGYYVGYLAAAEAGKSRSLQQLATMSPAEVRPLLEASLRQLEDCA